MSDSCNSLAATKTATALRRGLPYGLVMATAGTSTVAGQWGLQTLAMALLGLAILQALWVLINGIWRHRSEFRLDCSAWWAIGPAHEHTGVHTIPLGLAVIVGGLTRFQLDGSMPWQLATNLGLALVWLTATLCVSRFLWSLVRHGLRLQTLDGAWFLVPAVLLGAGIATQQVAANLSGWMATGLAQAALTSVLLGWFGYVAVTLIACVRVWRFGLGGVAQAPWWIAMGCAGLAAAALGHVIAGSVADSWLQHALVMAMLVTSIVAVILCVPIIASSIRFLLLHCQFRAKAVWPPTFSTAVFTLGCLQTGSILSSPAFHYLGLGAGLVTLALWAVTMIWNTKYICTNHTTP